ncbi:MAG: hypothetical protein IT463_06480 [Planctomycetes bacterium]|nr:hypothetical protein [Planctomycetota bacterium]
MAEIAAELAYLFRHALLRDTAYQLQLPGERARLHALAFQLIEQAFGGRAPEPGVEWRDASEPYREHAADAMAVELAHHALCAAEQEGTAAGAADQRLGAVLYLTRAARRTEQALQFKHAQELWMHASRWMLSPGQADALCKAAHAAYQRGLLAVSQELASQALVIARAAPDARATGAALNALAAVALREHKLDEFTRLGEEALQVARSCGDRYNEAAACSKLANHYVGQGHYERGRQLNQHAAALFTTMGNRRAALSIVINLGNLDMMNGEPAIAEERLRQALKDSRAENLRDLEAYALWNVAKVLSSTSRTEEAVKLLYECLSVAGAIGNAMVVGIGWRELAHFRAANGDASGTESCLAEAVAALSESDLPLLATVRWEHALSLLQLGRRVDAVGAWQLAVASLQRAERNDELQQSRRRMLDTCARLGEPPLA